MSENARASGKAEFEAGRRGRKPNPNLTGKNRTTKLSKEVEEELLKLCDRPPYMTVAQLLRTAVDLLLLHVRRGGGGLSDVLRQIETGKADLPKQKKPSGAKRLGGAAGKQSSVQ